ncbi:PEP-CTERM sorting domain-containing protein [Haloferula sp.]|uniref:PEP-CTERM sorting domain-containing protein n=1 Tax=Haloferula sp. TaxID=2497595 RepID=UPI00329CAB1B
MNSLTLSSLALLFGGVLQAQVFQFNGITGVNSSTDDSIDGWSIADQYGGSNYSGYAGEMSLIFANDGDVPGGLGVPRGTFVGDVGGSYADKLGLVVFCTDPNTGFRESGSPADVFTFEAHSLASAESRYLAEGVSGYRSGGLRRAAYLIENFYDEAHAAGDLAAAALQAAIWEVLTDSDPSLSMDDGNYFLRNNSLQSVLNLRSNQMVALTDAWFADAVADGWGGAGYDPANRVAFWLDPTNIHLNQTVISLNPDPMSLSLVPEPSSGLMMMIGGVMLAMRRRRLQD